MAICYNSFPYYRCPRESVGLGLCCDPENLPKKCPFALWIQHLPIFFQKEDAIKAIDQFIENPGLSLYVGDFDLRSYKVGEEQPT